MDCIINLASDGLKKSVIVQCSAIRNEEKWAIETRTLQKMPKVVYDKEYLTIF